jgi:hypothetical protein
MSVMMYSVGELDQVWPPWRQPQPATNITYPVITVPVAPDRTESVPLLALLLLLRKWWEDGKREQMGDVLDVIIAELKKAEVRG